MELLKFRKSFHSLTGRTGPPPLFHAIYTPNADPAYWFRGLELLLLAG